MVGRVVSTKMQKTAVVIVERRKKHPLYQKSYVRTKKYLTDDPFGVSDGDVVILKKIRPMSKNKHWQIVKVLGRDIVSLEQAELQEEALEAIAEVLPEDRKIGKSEESETSSPADEIGSDQNEEKVNEEKPVKKVRKTKKETK